MGFRDWCYEQGYIRSLAERALAHTVKNNIETACHRTDLLEKRHEIMRSRLNLFVLIDKISSLCQIKFIFCQIIIAHDENETG